MFTNVNDLPDMQLMLDEHYVVRRKHPEFDLYIHNYTPRATYDHVWNEATTSCRGLITDRWGTVVSRPFRKFFNLHEVGALPINEDYTVFEKLDGSLGISYFWMGRHWIATRGSFDSEQAKLANNMLAEEYLFVPLMFGLTYLFEIVGPSNRVVVSYPFNRLVILGKIITDTGEEIIPGHVHPGFPSPRTYNIDLKGSMPEIPNFEGFVVRFESGLRVKIKQEEYCRRHRLITGLNKRTIWEFLSGGKSLDNIINLAPEELELWIIEIVSYFRRAYSALEDDAKSIFRLVRENGDCVTRKDYAKYFVTYPSITAILFHMLDNKPYEQLIWKAIKPRGDE
jgi:RNA ligase